MLSLFEDNDPLFLWFLFTTVFFIGASFLICVLLVARRYYRNHVWRSEKRQKEELIGFVSTFLTEETLSLRPQLLPKYPPRIVSQALLHCFRIFQSGYAEQLKIFVDNHGLDSVLVRGLRGGTLGDRTRAMQVLSYLDTASSLNELSKAIHHGSLYSWIVAARGLARRQAYWLVPELVSALSSNFDRKAKLLKSILVKFGPNVLPELATILARNNDEKVIAACLETAAHFTSTDSQIDPEPYLRHKDENVRAAALTLLAATNGPAVMQHVHGDLTNEPVTIRMRAAKLARKVKRPEFSIQLLALMNDSHFWVRYWAAKALVALGPSGRDILTVVSCERSDAGRMAREVIQEAEAADV